MQGEHREPLNNLLTAQDYSRRITIIIMAPKRLGGSRRSYNPVTHLYDAFFVSENAPIVRSVTAFGVRRSHSHRSYASLTDRFNRLPSHSLQAALLGLFSGLLYKHIMTGTSR